MNKTATTLLLFLLASLCAHAQQFTGIRVKQDGDNVTISYGLGGKSGQTYDISVSCTSSEQGTIVPHSLSGDLKSVSPGSDFKFTLEAVPTGVQDYTETVNGASFDMVAVEGGTFQMGSNNGEDDEKPVHSVSLSDFCIGKTEVTIGQYLVFCKETDSHYPKWLEKGNEYNIHTGTNDYYKKAGMSESNEDNPITGISWNDAIAFCNWLGDKTGKHYRLPTEAEWEYAVRGGKKSRGHEYSGSNTIGNVAWYDDNSGGKTHPVGTKQSNELGLYDMTGNVWEWCSDWYNSGYYKNSPRNNPQGASSGTDRVNRGGSWNNDARYCRVANRSIWDPGYRDNNLGFRLAVSPR